MTATSTIFSQVIENSSEQVLSGDLNRMQVLASRDAQNVLENASRGDAFVLPDGTPGGNNNEGQPIDRADNLGWILGNDTSFQVAMGPGQVFMDLGTDLVDQSNYSVVRWPATQFTITPDGSQVRVDLIYATPAMVASDLQSRNILVDPVARTVAPLNVNKTNSPLATVEVLTGTPGSSSAPACPAGSVALWEVVTLNLDTRSSDYRFIPRIWRRVESFGSCHALLQNCVPQWTTSDESVSSEPFLDHTRVHRAVIDGEVIVAADVRSTIFDLIADPDTNANPLTATIVTTYDVPAYLYLCGGRHAPQNGYASSRAFVTPAYNPLRLVTSKTPPTGGGRASADLAINGVAVPAAGTLYAGLAFISKSTHNYKSCNIDGDWIYASTGVTSTIANFYEASTTGGSGTLTIHPPAPSTMCDIALYASDSASPCNVILMSTTGSDRELSKIIVPVTVTIFPFFGHARCGVPSGGSFNWSNGNSTTTVQLTATAYNMNVPRIGR